MEKNLSSRQLQVIIGTILGGSSLAKTKKGKNFYLMMRDKNSSWMQKKVGELISLGKNEIVMRDGTNRWCSRCLNKLTELSKFFYKNKKRELRAEILDSLMDIGLAVWYLDCASIINDKIVFNTNIWGEKGSKKIVKYFEIIDYQTKIIDVRHSIRVCFNEASTENLLKLINPCISEYNINGRPKSK